MNAAIHAPALPAMTPELLAALREWHRTRGAYSLKANATDDLFYAVLGAGILAPPPPKPPGVTDVQATLQEGWWV